MKIESNKHQTIPSLITGDTYDLSLENQNQMRKLNLDSVFIDFFMCYNSQEVYNEILFKGANIGISGFGGWRDSLEERNARLDQNKVFGNSIIFAYGDSPYIEYTYMISGNQKGKVLKIVSNNVNLKMNDGCFIIDDYSAVLLANSFEEFISNLTMGEIDVINRERKRTIILLTGFNGERVPVMNFLKKEKKLANYEEAKSMLNELPISLGYYDIERIKDELISLNCEYTIEEDIQQL